MGYTPSCGQLLIGIVMVKQYYLAMVFRRNHLPSCGENMGNFSLFPSPLRNEGHWSSELMECTCLYQYHLQDNLESSRIYRTKKNCAHCMFKEFLDHSSVRMQVQEFPGLPHSTWLGAHLHLTWPTDRPIGQHVHQKLQQFALAIVF